MTTASRFPALLTATSALRAVTDLEFPNTAVKNKLAVSSFEVRMLSFGTTKSIQLAYRNPQVWGINWLTCSKVCDVGEEVEEENERQRDGRVSFHGLDRVLQRVKVRQGCHAEERICMPRTLISFMTLKAF